MSQFLIPRLLKADIEHGEDVWEIFSPIRGHNMAKAALEMACWDLISRRRGVPLATLLGGTRTTVPVGVSIGIQESPGALVDTVGRFLGDGYRRVKLKIAPGADVEYVTAVRHAYPRAAVQVDANSAYTLNDTQTFLDMDDLNLLLIEQPLSPDDIVDHATLQRELTTPICLDESIHSPDDARHALDLGSCRIINIKVSRLGGLSEARRVHDLCRAREVPVWCGGMHEFGVGRAANVAICSLPGFTLPGDVSGSDRAYREDIVDPPIRAHAGAIDVPWDRPGLGFDANLERIRARSVRELVLESERATAHA
jgi:O-succinylbenzoate synthase